MSKVEVPDFTDAKLLFVAELHGDHIAHIVHCKNKNAEEYILQHLRIKQKRAMSEGWHIGKNIGLSIGEKILAKDRIISFAQQVVDLSEEANEIWGRGYLTKQNEKLYLYRHTHFVELDATWIERLFKEDGLNFGVDLKLTRSAQYFSNFTEQLIYCAHPAKLDEPNRININFLNGVGSFDTLGNWMFKQRKLNEFPKWFTSYCLPFCYELSEKEQLRQAGLGDKAIELAQTSFDPRRIAQQWMRFLDQVIGEEEAIWLLHEFIASCFIPNSVLKLEKSLFLIGEGSNGKSVIYEVIVELLGKENVSDVPLNKLGDSVFQSQLIENKLLNYAPEISANYDPTIFKNLVSQEGVQVEGKHENPRPMEKVPRLMFNGNQKPRSKEHSHAVLRRMIFVPFKTIIKEEDQDKQLASKLKQELPQIFLIVREAMKRLMLNKDFTSSPMCEAEKRAYERELNSVKDWIEDTGLKFDAGARFHVRAIYDAYVDWCSSNACAAVSTSDFKRAMEAQGFSKERINSGEHRSKWGWTARMPLPNE